MSNGWKTIPLLPMASRNTAGLGSTSNVDSYDHASLVIGMNAISGGLHIDLLESFNGDHWYSIVGTLDNAPIVALGDGAYTFPIDHPLAPYYKLKYSFVTPGDSAEFDANLYGIDTEDN